MTSTNKHLPFKPSAYTPFFRRFFGDERARELSETVEFYERVKAAYEASVYAEPESAGRFIVQVVKDACERAGIVPSRAFGEMLIDTVSCLIAEDDTIFGFHDVASFDQLGLEEGVSLRAYLRRKERFLQNSERFLDIWGNKVASFLAGVTGYLPPAAISDSAEDDDAEEDENPSPTVSLIDLCEKPAEALERAIVTFFDADVRDAGLFETTRELLDNRALLASGILPEDRETTRRPIVLPTEATRKSNAQLVESYLRDTSLETLFAAPLPFSIPYPARFEHTHIVGGSGHGKTQLMQLMIHRDLMKAKEDGRSVVVIDSQGDLIRTISHLDCFSPWDSSELADRLVIIDPNDVEHPACLNMFDFNRGRLERYAPVDREKILNGTVELFEYMFGALLGAELTQKQGVIFRYLARLMLEIPDATVHTFRELMEDGEKFRPYMERLQGTARSFFATRFFDRSFNETKKQILTRLWGVLANATFERMFSNPTNKVDMFEAMNSGKIVLINTAKELLKQDGCAIFGRFFISLIAQAAIQRAALPPHERRPTFVYIDETQDYFDQNIENLLNQARKYRVGMVLAHQNLDQLSTALRASIMASTSIKFAGGVSAKDAKAFAQDMRCDSEFVQDRRKRADHTEFACWIKNLTPQAVGVTVPLGTVDRLPVMTGDDWDILIADNRARYCAIAQSAVATPTTAPPPPAPVPLVLPQPAHTAPPVAKPYVAERPRPARPAPPPSAPVRAPEESLPLRPMSAEVPPPLGRGGRQHQYLQHLLKQMAEDRGWRAIIEEPILDGAGRVDVAVTAGEMRIACEISVNTRGDQELGNIEKCLAAGFSLVLLIAPEQRHLNTMRKFIGAHLEPDAAERVRFLVPDEFVETLESLPGTPAKEERVRGYKVKVTHQVLSEEEAAARRQTISQVLARSLGRMKRDE